MLQTCEPVAPPCGCRWWATPADERLIRLKPLLHMHQLRRSLPKRCLPQQQCRLHATAQHRQCLRLQPPRCHQQHLLCPSERHQAIDWCQQRTHFRLLQPCPLRSLLLRCPSPLLRRPRLNQLNVQRRQPAPLPPPRRLYSLLARPPCYKRSWRRLLLLPVVILHPATAMLWCCCRRCGRTPKCRP